MAGAFDDLIPAGSQASQTADPFADLVPKAKAAKPPGNALEAFGAGLGAGVGQVAMGAQHYAGKALGAVGADRAGQWLVDDAAAGRAKLAGEVAPYKESNPIAAGVGEFGGNVAATLPVGGVLGKAAAATMGRVAPAGVALGKALSSGGMASGLGIGSRVAGGAVTGGTTAALIDPGNTESIALGAALGGALPAVAAGVGRVINPRAASNPNLQALRAEGVDPTIGQALGGNFGRFEEKLASVPVLGDSIRSARTRATEQLNKAALNRALAPIGEKVDAIGREGIEQVGAKLGQAYDDLVPKLAFKADDTFSADIARLGTLADDLEPGPAASFTKALRDKVVGKLSPAGGMTGQTFKQVEGDLGKLARDYSKSAMASERQLGGALMELQDAMRRGLERSNPQQSAQLKAINEGYANYVRLRSAASGLGAEGGVFSPAQLANAVKAGDSSVGKGGYAKGRALMQDLSDAGRQVLGDKVPNSGTVDRALPTLGLIGAGAMNPAIPLSVLGGSLAYTPQLQRALVSSLASRPQSAQAVAQGFRKGASVLVPGAVPASLYVGRD